MVKVPEQGGQEEALKEFQEQKSEKLDIMAPKTGKQWVDLYNGLAGKEIYQGANYSELSSDAPLSYEDFQAKISGESMGEHRTLYSADPVLLSKIDMLIKELGGREISDEERAMQNQIEKSIGKKSEVNVMKLKAGNEWMNLYNALAGRKFLTKINYGENRQAMHGKPLSFEEFKDFVKQTVSYDNQNDLDVLDKIEELIIAVDKKK